MRWYQAILCIGAMFSLSANANEAISMEEMEAYQRALSASSVELASDELTRHMKLKHFVRSAMYRDIGLSQHDWLEVARIKYEVLAERKDREAAIKSSICGKAGEELSADDIVRRLQSLDEQEVRRWEEHYYSLRASLSPQGLELLESALSRSELGPGAAAQKIDVAAVASVDPKMFRLLAQEGRCRADPMRSRPDQ